MMRRRLARLVTEVLAPAPVATILLFIVAWHSTRSVAIWFQTCISWSVDDMT